MRSKISLILGQGPHSLRIFVHLLLQCSVLHVIYDLCNLCRWTQEFTHASIAANNLLLEKL